MQPALGVAQLGYEPPDLALVGDGHEAMLDVSLALLGVGVLVTAGVGRVGLGDLADLALQRGAEQQRLALARAHLHDPVDDGLEAHVEHPVGLVEHEQPDAVERDVTPVDQVEQPSRCGDEDVCARGEARLLDDPGAAVDGRDRERAGVGDVAQVVDDLRGQLARRRQHERRGAHVRAVQAFDHGIPNASVLPDPVGDWASTSCPAITSAMTSFWTANGWVISRLASSSTTTSDTPRSANVACCMLVLLLLASLCSPRRWRFD